MSAFGRGLLSGLAGGLQGVEKFKEAETDYNRKMTLEEFRAAKEMEREKFRQSFEREQKGLDRAIETSKMGMDQVNTTRRLEISADYNDILRDQIAARGAGGSDASFTGEERKKMEGQMVTKLTSKYLSTVPELSWLSGITTMNEFVTELTALTGSQDPNVRQAAQAALRDAEAWNDLLTRADKRSQGDAVWEAFTQRYKDDDDTPDDFATFMTRRLGQ